MRMNDVRRLTIDLIKGDSTRARAMRSSAILVIGFGGSNLIRLASNLILARLLFPEAFGLMSLVYIFLTGLAMFSDLGLNVSIIQNNRGENPAFLNTVWSLQIIRGGLLWLCACALALPAATFYGEPQLAALLPVAGLTALIQGFATTKIALANRNLQIGVQVSTDLASQIATLAVTAVAAWLTGSVWSLVAGAIAGNVFKVLSQHIALKGPRNYWYMDRNIVTEIIHFGKYIFLGSVAGFFINQGDRAILGKYVSLTDLGVYSISFMFATVPLEITRAAGSQIIFPLFSKFPSKSQPENRRKVLRARRFVILSTASLCGIISVTSVPMINILYDYRYHESGPILALLSFSTVAQIASSNYDGAYLAPGNSKLHFRLIMAQAIIQIILAWALISGFGILGAIFSVGASALLVYPFRARAAHLYGAWDPKTDLLTLITGWLLTMLALHLWRNEIISFAMK